MVSTTCKRNADNQSFTLAHKNIPINPAFGSSSFGVAISYKKLTMLQKQQLTWSTVQSKQSYFSNHVSI